MPQSGGRGKGALPTQERDALGLGHPTGSEKRHETVEFRLLHRSLVGVGDADVGVGHPMVDGREDLPEVRIRRGGVPLPECVDRQLSTAERFEVVGERLTAMLRRRALACAPTEAVFRQAGISTVIHEPTEPIPRPEADALAFHLDQPGMSAGSSRPWRRQPIERSQVLARATGDGTRPAADSGALGVVRSPDFHPSNHRAEEAGSKTSPMRCAGLPRRCRAFSNT